MKFITVYNHNWSKRYEQIATYLKQYLHDSCRFHHVGSTSIIGMPAKDIIDLDIEYVHGCLNAVIGGLKKAGYEHEGDLGIQGREAFKPVPNSPAESLPAHHLYACEHGALELRKHLSFRNYLRAHPERVAWLSDKKLLADTSVDTRDEYIENKSHFYKTITEESMKWAENLLKATA